MTLKSYLWGMRFSTLLALAAWGLAVFYTDPEKGGAPVKFIFYCTLFLFLSGIFILILSLFRRKLSKDGMALSDLGMSFREGMLLALLVIILLVLQSFRFLVWWDGLLVVAGIFLMELYFLTK
jgi:hypothetical protein